MTGEAPRRATVKRVPFIIAVSFFSHRIMPVTITRIDLHGLFEAGPDYSVTSITPIAALFAFQLYGQFEMIFGNATETRY